MKNALISVYDKSNIIELAKDLIALGYNIYATDGTYEFLSQHKLKVQSVESLTQFPEIMDGRVKTLHPKIHGGLLGQRTNSVHQSQAKTHDMVWIDLLIVNLYPFKETMMDDLKSHEEIIEQIDIGGCAMIRSAAKNHMHVGVIIDPKDYDRVLMEIKAKEHLTPQTKKYLAGKAFRLTAQYDTWIASYLTQEAFPETLNLTYVKKEDLRYGENPHQIAALYQNSFIKPQGLFKSTQLHGKQMSYNNIQDAQAALSLINAFDDPTVVAIKHMNPCGVGSADTIEKAYHKAYEADPVSIFGGIIAFNKSVTKEIADHINQLFIEVVLAPGYDDEALEILKQKKNIRIIEISLNKEKAEKILTSVQGGILLQSEDDVLYENLTFPTQVKPTQVDIEELMFAFKIVKHMKSNAIAISKDFQTVGLGVGQTSRVGATKNAIEQAGEKTMGAYLASDAFLPMKDTVEAAIEANIKAIIQPGGSLKDQESIDLCDLHGISMIFTQTRHFKH
jgi:phosphoribosylaminoimidazolecarboxamide formyltransferase / IMP cyclohydrolase